MVVRDPEARYFGGRVEERSLVRWAKRALAISVSTKGCAAHRQKPDAASEVDALTIPAGARWLAGPRHLRKHSERVSKVIDSAIAHPGCDAERNNV